MNYCPHCGAKIQPTDNFCIKCGIRLTVPIDSDHTVSGASLNIPQRPKRFRSVLWIAASVLFVVLMLTAILIPRGFSSGGRRMEAPLPVAVTAPVNEGGENVPTALAGSSIDAVYAAAAPFENEDGSVSPENAQDAIDAVYTAALQNPEVISCAKDKYGVFMEVAEGPDYVYCPPIEGTASGGELKIITIQPFDTMERKSAKEDHHTLLRDFDAPDDVAREAAEKDRHWVFAADVNDDEVTMDRILSLSDYQVILWLGHGGYTERSGYYICTDISWSEELAQRYGLDKSFCYRYEGKNNAAKVGLRPAFFERKENFPDGAFNNAFIYLGTCYSGKEETMARTLLGKGAAVVFVDSELISCIYCEEMLHLIAESFLVGPEGAATSSVLRSLTAESLLAGTDPAAAINDLRHLLTVFYTISNAENRTIEDSLCLAQLRYGKKDPFPFYAGAEVYYLCRPGVENMSYAEWINDFETGESPVEQTPEESEEPSIAVADGQYWAILYAETDAENENNAELGTNYPHFSTEVDLEDYMCFSNEEIEALHVGDTLEMSRFVPIWKSISFRVFGEYSADYEDIPVASIKRVNDELLYINPDRAYLGDYDILLQNWNGCWRVITDEPLCPLRCLRSTVTLPIDSNVIITDYFTPWLHQQSDATPVKWNNVTEYLLAVADFLPSGIDHNYTEAQVTVKNGIITEIMILSPDQPLP